MDISKGAKPPVFRDFWNAEGDEKAPEGTLGLVRLRIELSGGFVVAHRDVRGQPGTAFLISFTPLPRPAAGR